MSLHGPGSDPLFVCLSQLWENAIHCWMDVQHYRELFYQEGLDPYRVQREAQVGPDREQLKLSTLTLMDVLVGFECHTG